MYIDLKFTLISILLWKEEKQCHAQAVCINTYDHKQQCRYPLQFGWAPSTSVNMGEGEKKKPQWRNSSKHKLVSSLKGLNNFLGGKFAYEIIWLQITGGIHNPDLPVRCSDFKNACKAEPIKSVKSKASWEADVRFFWTALYLKYEFLNS